jgi:hypothetical protein
MFPIVLIKNSALQLSKVGINREEKLSFLGAKSTLETSGEDVKTTLQTSGEDANSNWKIDYK